MDFVLRPDDAPVIHTKRFTICTVYYVLVETNDLTKFVCTAPPGIRTKQLIVLRNTKPKCFRFVWQSTRVVRKSMRCAVLSNEQRSRLVHKKTSCNIKKIQKTLLIHNASGLMVYALFAIKILQSDD